MPHEQLIRDARTHCEAGRYAEAEAPLRQALQLRPDDVRAQSLLGFVQSGLGQHAAAAQTYEALTRLQPEVARHWANLGTALRSSGEFDRAFAAYDRAGELGEASADFLLNLGLLHIDRYEFGRARAALGRAAAVAPNDAEIRYFHAVVCYEQVQNEEAAAELSRWRSFAGLTPDLLARVGALLTQLGAMAEAEGALREALRLEPAHAVAAVRLAQLLERQNRVAEARSQLATLPPAPAAGELADELLSCEARLAERADDFATARVKYRRLLAQTRELHQRYHVLFPLARVEDQLGDYAAAYASAQAGHESQLAFLQKAAPRFLEPRAQSFGITRFSADPADVAAWRDAQAPAASESPIFIVGFPRSGTTLLEQMLDAHPQLRAMDEQPFLQNAIDQLRGDGVQYPERLAPLPDVQAVRDYYWQRARSKLALAPGERLVDKNPLNLLRLPAIRRLFPHARVILAIRHPADVLVSNFMQHYRAPEIAAMCRSLASLAEAYVRAFDFWYRQSALLAPAVLELKYEDFVGDFEAQAHGVADFLGLPWHDAMLKPAEQALRRGYISTPSYSQVVAPVNRRAVGRWRNYEPWLRPVLPALQRYLARWGYEAGAEASTNSE